MDLYGTGAPAGIGDVSSAVAHRLFSEGYDVAIDVCRAAPSVHRQAMTFGDAWFDGTSEMDGLEARTTPLEKLEPAIPRRTFIPVLTAEFKDALRTASWDVIVDARMRKRTIPEDAR
jgi:xanthine dehydrogenase accessory factor